MRSFSDSYREAGVNIEAGYEGVKLMRRHVARTMIPGVVSDIGGFGGLFAPDIKGMAEPVLVSGTDGVGTKIRIAQLLDKHDTIASIVSGVAEGCVQSGCALIGGETAEHPGMMAAGDYDLAGFSVGIVDKPKVIDNSRMAPGDVILALPSSGIHSNGFSLVRKVFDVEHAALDWHVPELGRTLGEALLEPTVIYVKPVLRCMEAADVKGVSHITGGGFFENIPRCIPEGLGAKIDKAAVRTPAIFKMLQEQGNISEHDMFNTFNMGVGMTVVVPKEDADRAIAALDCGAYVVGEIVSGGEKVTLC